MRPIFRSLSGTLLLAALPVLALAQASPAARPVGKPAAATGKVAPSTEAEVPAPKIKPMRDPALYKTEVTLTSQGANERKSATARGLVQVIVKLTGNQQAPVNTVVRRALGNAESYVSDVATQTGASDAEGNTAVGGAPIYKTTMSLSFDPVAVDMLIAGAGLKYWTGVRPRPVLWLAIDDGTGARLVTAKQINVVRPLAQRGVERGLRFGLPSGTAIEQSALPSVLALNGPALQVLSSRYNNDAQLVGKVYRAGGGWTGDWVLSQGGVELGRWSFSDADARRVIASGADPAADAIAARDSVYLDIGPAGTYAIEVANVETQDDFLRLMAYLQRVAIVKRATVTEVSGSRLRLMLDMSIGLRGFRTLVETEDTLQPQPDLPAPELAADAPGLPVASFPQYRLK